MSEKLTLEQIKEKISKLSAPELKELMDKLEPVFNSTLESERKNNKTN